MSANIRRIDLSGLAGVTLVKLGLVALDPEVPDADSRRLGYAVLKESDARGWPDGWHEDPSVLSAEQLGTRKPIRWAPDRGWEAR